MGLFILILLSLLPLSVLYVLSNGIYFFLFHVLKYRRKVVIQNLSNAFPNKTNIELLRIEKEFYRFLSALIIEIVKMNTISKKELLKRFRFKNADRIAYYLKNGQSVLVCAAHYGNWEWGSLAIGLVFSGRNHPIYKPLSNPTINNWLKNARSRFGNKMVAMRQTLRALQAYSHQPSIFCFAADQSPTKTELQYWTHFLNQPTSVQLGIEKIAKKTNRPIFYLKVKVLQQGYYEVDCISLCDNPTETAEFEITNLHTRFLEQMIKEDPAYWLWSHRRWKHQPKIKET